jgi:hypothetical protein
VSAQSHPATVFRRQHYLKLINLAGPPTVCQAGQLSKCRQLLTNYRHAAGCRLRCGKLHRPVRAAKCMDPKLVIWHDYLMDRLSKPGIACAMKKSSALLYEVRM